MELKLFPKTNVSITNIRLLDYIRKGEKQYGKKER